MATLETAITRRAYFESPRHEVWSSRWLFILAAAGSAVGLGNVWKFPYIVGENGGGAFVILYLGCIALIGLPILMVEMLLGRRGAQSPVNSMRTLTLALQAGGSKHWQAVGGLGMFTSLLILSFYSVIAGWALVYTGYAASGTFFAPQAVDTDVASVMNNLFAELLANPSKLILAHSAFMALTVFIVARGLKAGLENAARIMMPGLLGLLIILVVYTAVTTDRFDEGLSFMLWPDFHAFTWEATLVALGHAFFTLSVGLGVMMAYGSYLPHNVSISKAAVTVTFLDTAVALLAGLVIFPVTFAYGLEQSAGPGLIFISLPIAFSEMPGGQIIGILFFLFLVLAALTSSISLLEPTVEYLQEKFYITRRTAAITAAVAVWLLGIVSALSFNLWSEIKFFNKNIFDFFDFLTANILLPLGGLLIALFAGWVISKATVKQELNATDGWGFTVWHFVLRFITPFGVVVVFFYNLL